MEQAGAGNRKSFDDGMVLFGFRLKKEEGGRLLEAVLGPVVRLAQQQLALPQQVTLDRHATLKLGRNGPQALQLLGHPGECGIGTLPRQRLDRRTPGLAGVKRRPTRQRT